MLHGTGLHCVMLNCTRLELILGQIVLNCTAQYNSLLFYAKLRCILLWRAMLGYVQQRYRQLSYNIYKKWMKIKQGREEEAEEETGRIKDWDLQV